MKEFILVVLLAFLSQTIFSQEKCGTEAYTLELMERYPDYKVEREKVNLQTEKWIKNNPNHNPKTIITIPVVVHVVWNTNAENISDAQIFSQMDILNDDFTYRSSHSGPCPGVPPKIIARIHSPHHRYLKLLLKAPL